MGNLGVKMPSAYRFGSNDCEQVEKVFGFRLDFQEVNPHFVVSTFEFFVLFSAEYGFHPVSVYMWHKVVLLFLSPHSAYGVCEGAES